LNRPGAALRRIRAGCLGLAGRAPERPDRAEELEEVSRFAAVFDREARSELGRRVPLLGMFPLRMWRTLRNKRR
jgi:hypothetical protein